MVSTIQNTNVKQKEADRAVVVAVTSRAVFDCGADDGDEVCEVGVAFPLLQALQRVNERLLEENPSESLLFDVVLITSDSQQQQQSSRIISNTRHHGLEISRFCFSSEEDFTESLLQNNVHLFLTTDRDEAAQASQKGVFSALLNGKVASSEQLRVVFCGDAVIRTDAEPPSASQDATQSFWALNLTSGGGGTLQIHSVFPGYFPALVLELQVQGLCARVEENFKCRMEQVFRINVNAVFVTKVQLTVAWDPYALSTILLSGNLQKQDISIT
ncbi:cytosolic 5'-nucleotidase 1A-like [Notothenia coriiceps]|uniref:Cytosolic 5'-nucleotidase 1A-like n=1 Tax=Notothenia coriiceps TaxID=8208 RepID=A0A6I9NIW2_9TELE|nr:PREDICTED: cytosolic 5'-nucleotidase 1A-like [Notothenia coriiceps]